MDLTLSLTKHSLETEVGSVLNSIHFRKRRNVMFFEGISAGYAKMCEDAGHGEEMFEIGEQWFRLIYYSLIPPFMKALPKPVLLPMLGNIWRGIGALDEIHVAAKKRGVVVDTKNEAITRTIGPNQFMAGVFAGAYSVVFNKTLEPAVAEQSKKRCHYFYKFGPALGEVKAKTRQRFNKLNQINTPKGFTVKAALTSGVFKNKDNKLYFRGALVATTDSTVYHLMGNRGIMLDGLAPFSHGFFAGLIEKKSKPEEKLTLLKTLLQVMGWGIVTIAGDLKKKISVSIKNPPYGFQKEDDNWEFLARVVLGYLWLVNPKLKLKKMDSRNRRLVLRYSQ